VKFNDLRGVVQGSVANDWHKIDSVGPTYRERWHTWTGYSDGEATNGLSVDSHYAHAVYKHDVNLSLTWGMDRSWDPMSGRPDRDDSFDWSKGNPDPSVGVFFADIFWGGTLVDREFLIHVDGGRGVVPLGTTRRKPGASFTGRSPSDFYESCTMWERDFAELIDTLDGGSEFDRYFGVTGYVIEER
jgi:hypothetical protein